MLLVFLFFLVVGDAGPRVIADGGAVLAVLAVAGVVVVAVVALIVVTM